ncbi:hypothetical protein [Acrocarpospora corrugata]|uniref:hypothetical protein n=1 Tax=Acrocarpospora corrugata TaxID=35763 RepID=UPI00147905A5
MRYYDGQIQLPEAILRGNLEKMPNLAAMASAVDFLVTLMPVTARIAAQHHAVRLDGAPGLLALMTCDMVLHRRDEASRRWLIKETNKILNEDKDAEKVQLRRVWLTLFTVYARDTWPIEDILDKFVERVPGQPGRF